MSRVTDGLYVMGVGFTLSVGWAVGSMLTRWFFGVIKQLASEGK